MCLNQRSLMWVLSLLLAAGVLSLGACQPPQATTQIQSTPPQASYKIQAARKGPNRVPLSSYHIEGLKKADSPELNLDFIREVEEKVSGSKQGFKIKDYPVASYGCNSSCGVNSLNANYTYPSNPIGHTSDSITLQTPGLTGTPNLSGYAYGINVTAYGRSADGKTIATKLRAGYSIATFTNAPPYPSLKTGHGGAANFISSDGINFVPELIQPSNTGAGLSYNYKPEPQENCALATNGSVSGQMPLSTAKVTLDPESGTAELDFSFNGRMSGGGWSLVFNKDKMVNECLLFHHNEGPTSAHVKMTVKLGYVNPSDINIEADPAFIPDNAGKAESKLTVTPENTSQSWTVDVDSPNKTDCPQPSRTGTGVKVLPFPFTPANLTNGTYAFTARYTNAGVSNEQGKTTVKVNLPVKLDPDQQTFYPLEGGSANWEVKIPPCPQDWTIELNGNIVSPDGHAATCTKILTGQGSGPISWDGQCTSNMPHPITGDLIQGVAFGQWHARLHWKDKDFLAKLWAGEAPPADPTPPPGDPCPPGEVCQPGGDPGGDPGGGPSSDPNDPPGPSSGPSTGPSPTPGPSDSPTPTPSPTATPTQGPSPTPTPSGGGGSCTQPGYRIVYDPALGGEACVYCPSAFFDYDNEHQCHTRMALEVSYSVPAQAPSPMPSDAPLVFSPRDVNGFLDSLNFTPTSQAPAAPHIKWDMVVNPLGSDGGIFPAEGLWSKKDQKGLTPFLYDGWTDVQACIGDGKYEVALLPKPKTAEPGVYEITVPGFPQPVHAKIVFPEDPDGKPLDKREFWVDNTPPVVKDVSISQSPQNPQPGQAVSTTVKFTVKEPLVNGTMSGLRAEKERVKVYVDAAPFYAAPVVDEAGFWITSLLGQDLFSVTPMPVGSFDGRTAEVSFTVQHRLPGHTVEVEVEDQAGNKGRYILYPQGGNF